MGETPVSTRPSLWDHAADPQAPGGERPVARVGQTEEATMGSPLGRRLVRVATVVMCAGLLVGVSPVGGVGPAAGSAAPGPDVRCECVDDARSAVDLSDGWRFHLGDVADAALSGYDDAGWERVAVPHTWNAVDGLDTTHRVGLAAAVDAADPPTRNAPATGPALSGPATPSPGPAAGR